MMMFRHYLKIQEEQREEEARKRALEHLKFINCFVDSSLKIDFVIYNIHT